MWWTTRLANWLWTSLNWPVVIDSLFLVQLSHLIQANVFNFSVREMRRVWQTDKRCGNFERKMDDSLTSWNVMTVLASDLMAQTSNGAADDFRLSAFFGIISLIFDSCGSRLSALPCQTVKFLSFSHEQWKNIQLIFYVKDRKLILFYLNTTKCNFVNILTQLCIMAYPPCTFSSGSNEALTKASKTSALETLLNEQCVFSW